MEFLPNIGACDRNAEIPEYLISKSKWEQKITIIRNYKFTLCFENSNEKDYVTEKFFQAIADGGSLPGIPNLENYSFLVYFGAPNIEDFAPSPKSFIKVTDFKYKF